MSTKKDPTVPKALQIVYDQIKDLLLKIKPKLHEASAPERVSLVSELYAVASQAESFTEQRPRSKKKWSNLADELDREGVLLWNASGTVRRDAEDGDHPAIIGALRFAAFRLIEAGLEPQPGIETLLHVLQISSKAGSTLSELGSKEKAASVLACAAKFEETLRSVEDPQGLHHKAKACATVVYLSSRMEAAWREGNNGVAQFMLDKITENDHQRFALLPTRDRELLASKILEIGQSMLKSVSRGPRDTDSAECQRAVQWIQKAFAMAEQLADTATPGVAELKRSILRSLARAYFFSASHDPENLARAEAALQELITSIDASADHASPEFQELRWMRIAVLKRRNTAEAILLDAFKSLIDNMTFSDTTLTDLFLELRTLAPKHRLLSTINRHCLQCALQTKDESGYPFIDRILLSSIIHSSKDDDHDAAIRDLDAVFNDISDAEFELSKVSTIACLTLMWQYGNRHYQAKRFSEAADWFLSGSHKIFKNMGPTSSSKCFRKAALCHIERREYAKASAIIRRCPTTEATTHYVIMLTAINQGLEDEAVRALRDMVKAPDFERRMLLLVTQLSHKAGMNILLLSVLEALLTTLNTRDSIDTIVEAVTLIRCSIRLALVLLEEPAANRPVLTSTLIQYFISAKVLVDGACSTKAAPMVAKDVSWLWRTAYNTAVQACSEWESMEDRISELFDISRQLLEAHCQMAMSDVGADAYLHIINASYATISARVFALRGAPVQQGLANALVADIAACKTRINNIVARNIPWEDEYDASRIQSFLCSLRIFEVEMLCQLKDWKAVATAITEAVETDPSSLATFEAIADLLWGEPDCPVNVLFGALEAILHAALDRGILALEKFSRWLRAICAILLCRSTEADRATALGYVEQALTVLADDHDNIEDPAEIYPIDEREWLLSTAYNTGLECLHASMFDESKRWFETSTVICRFLPDGPQRSLKISETYMELLSRYTSAAAHSSD